MNQSEIESYCKSFLKDSYNLELAIPVIINSRLRSTLGQFVHTIKPLTPLSLEFSKKYLEYADRKDIIKLIKHECIHYSLYMQNKPHRDGDAYFESELIKHDSNATETVTFMTERNVRVYACKCKEHVFLSTITAKMCTVCKARLTYVCRRKELV